MTHAATVPSLKTGRMIAALLTGPRQVQLVNKRLPELNAHQVLVRLEGCGVCASNLPVWEGRDWFSYPLAPGAPGHEGWGRVAASGDAVEDFTVGERVALLSTQAYAEYDVADADALIKLPEALDDQPFPAEPLGCAMNIFRRCEIRAGQTVALVGAGFLGALLTQLATHAGARVLALSRRPYALSVARQCGAAETIPLDDNRRIIEQVKELTGGTGCECVIEATGHQGPLELAAELTCERGRLVIAGYHQDGPRQVNLQLWNWRGLDVINAHERAPQIYLRGMREAVHAVLSGQLNPASLYTHHFKLDQLGEALETTRTRPEAFIKALIQL
jgi:threonine dehydrogenase-like Zn-dependent dehydrogenase